MEEFTECKRCGKEFKPKYEGQIFCSRHCISIYKQRMNEMHDKYGREFNKWLNDKKDMSYAPERF
jgi:hypothetical protein